MRRGRSKTVCTHGAHPTWSSGPSTSPLDGMETTSPQVQGAPGTSRLGSPLLIAFWVLPATAVASWWTQYLVRFPSGTPGVSLTAWGFMLGSAAEAIPVALVITKLARIPRLRTWKNYLLVAIGTVASLPGLLIVFAVLTRA